MYCGRQVERIHPYEHFAYRVFGIRMYYSLHYFTAQERDLHNLFECPSDKCCYNTTHSVLLPFSSPKLCSPTQVPSSSQLQRKSHQRNTQLAHGIWYVELQCCIEAPMSSKGTSFWLLQARVEGSIWIGCVIRFHRFIISRGCAPGQTRALTVCVLFSAEVVRRGRRQKAMVVLPGWHACRCGESPFGFFHELSPYTQPTHEIFVGNLFCLPVSLGSRSVFCLHQQRGTSDWVSEWTWTRGVSFLVKFGSRRMKEGNFWLCVFLELANLPWLTWPGWHTTSECIRQRGHRAPGEDNVFRV